MLIWGYGGILSLGQGLFFGLGSYMMAMFLKLESTSSGSSAQALSSFFGSNLPDFMVWNSVEDLPWWWEPFHHVWFTLPAILILPTMLAFALAYAAFRKRVGGVYFSIITLSLSAILAIVIIGQQGVTGGVNGINDFRTFLGVDLDTDQAKRTMYYITCVLLLLCVLAGMFILHSRLGKVLVAIRDREDRVRFSGYDPALYKAFIFAVAALFSSSAARCSLSRWVCLALAGGHRAFRRDGDLCRGGRAGCRCSARSTARSLVGSAKTFFSENFVEYWMYFIGGLFVFIVMVLPDGLAGLLGRLRGRLRPKPASGSGPRGRAGRAAAGGASGDGEMSEVILAVEDLTVSFDGFRAVDGLNFYVEKDELRCVIGPNGAGKTTLLDMICGKTKPSHGRIHFKRYNLVDMIEYQITRVGRRAQVPDPVGVRGPDGVREPGDLLSEEARHPGLAVLQARPGSARGRSTRWPSRSFCTKCCGTKPAGSATARSSGWRSACC